MKKLSVLVGTCDAYSSLWPNFLICFDKYWKVSDADILFAGETKEVGGFPTYTPGKGLPWGARILGSLEKLQSDNIFFIFEDYFLSEELSDSRISQYLRDIEKHNINRLQISSRTGGQTYRINNTPYPEIINRNYIICCQPSIWKKRWLQEILLPNYSPWDFEIQGSKAVKNLDTKTFLAETAKPIYFNAARRGFVMNKDWPLFKKKENLHNVEPLNVEK